MKELKVKFSKRKLDENHIFVMTHIIFVALFYTILGIIYKLDIVSIGWIICLFGSLFITEIIMNFPTIKIKR